jgi:general secretion pathway protein N
MKRTILLALVALLAFAGILLARAPARWIGSFLPPQVQCSRLAGTIWNGSCGGLVAGGVPVGQLRWKLHPLRLFSGKLGTDFDLTRADGFVRGELLMSFDGRDVAARNLRASLPLDRSLAAQIPPSLAGKANAQLALLRVEGGVITAIQGRVEAHDLENRGSRPYQLGDYAVTFPGGEGEPTGVLESLDGPLDVKGTLRLTREPGYAVDGTVKAGPQTDPGLAKQLEYLGSPDAQGRRPFSLAGTF